MVILHNKPVAEDVKVLYWS